MTDTKSQIQRIELTKLIAHPDNPNRMSKDNFNKLVRNIEQTNCYEPLIVRPHPDNDNCFQLINGHHRKKALEKLEIKIADCIVWDIDDQQTDVLLMTLNRLGGSDMLGKKIAILKRLNAQIKTKSLAKLLPQSRKQIEQLSCLKLPEKPLKQTELPATPLIFFVTDRQKQSVEKAMSLIDTGEKIKAKRNADALNKIAEHFLECN